jgi:hypothetical protein
MKYDSNFTTVCITTGVQSPIHTSQDNIRIDLGEVGWGDVDWIGLATDRIRWGALVNSVFNLRAP